MQKSTKLLLIMDGWGHSENHENNAIAQANTPTWDSLNKKFPHSLINTSGNSVGLPDGQMGNSEVGHLNIGAGRIVEQNFNRINNDIKDGTFFTNTALQDALTFAQTNKTAVHIMGMLSDGGVHSHEKHIFAMLEMANKHNCDKIYLHLFTDGRDCAPKSAKKYIKNLHDKINSIKAAKIVSIVGRYFAMDRDNRWERVQQAYDLIAYGKAKFSAKDAKEAINMAYERGETDEFISPTTITNNIEINNDDAIIFINFRADRAREITRAFTDKNLNEITRKNFINTKFTCMTEYKEGFNLPVAYLPQQFNNTLGEYISNLGMSQLRIAETEKYAHVTFFFNGGVESPFALEDRVLVQSPDVATYDLQPEMNIFELTDKLVQSINERKYDLIVCNFANTDMVGHSGKLDATIKAVEAIDKCLQKIYQALITTDGEALITADHGNAEQMLDPKTGDAHTAHTSNLVPLLFLSKRKATIVGPGEGSLSDIAPTILKMMQLDKPSEMQGSSLVSFKNS